MEKVPPKPLKDIIEIAAAFDDVDRRRGVELVLGDYTASAVMERQGVESEQILRELLKQYTTCKCWLVLSFKQKKIWNLPQ